MKILFISSWFPSEVEPTNGNFVQRHAEAAALLNDVEILHSIGDFYQKEKYRVEENIINGIRTLIIYYKNSKNPIQNFYRRMKSYQLGFSKMRKPDVVHANVMHNSMLFAVYLKKKFKIPYVITEHWTAFQENASDSLGFVGNFIAKVIGNNASKILPVCERLERGIRNNGVKTPIEIIPNVVDTDVFKLRNDDGKRTKFLHISSLTYMKNIPAILDVFLKLHKNGYEFELSIGGDGDTKPIADFIHKHDLVDKINYFSTLSHAEVAKKMKDHDAFVLFSRYENQPCVISESMSVGLFVFSSDVGGISEFFPDKFGVLIEKEDSESLYKALENYLQYKTEIAPTDEMHLYAVKTFGKKAISEKFDKNYREVLQS
ncbi:glycosyltransferase [Chryseobacterium luquanense]|uniref:Glycosyltransferase n=1 Tax=Chryseobacterium luquanense TaxID=2983766 RepID=A0ABT3Y8L5_9FLAO|nr:glycosyltransferase [Chryseobacterium luquanense]MCX8534507.1 glycosyltransferase [Chryseobacterium luquanense]